MAGPSRHPRHLCYDAAFVSHRNAWRVPEDMKSLWTRARRAGRIAVKAGWALLDTHHPVLVHIVPMRRCNLSCAYCNEYDAVSQPVPLEIMLRRLDKLAELGTAMITVSGGEPLMHPDLDAMVVRMRERGMVSSLITNGYYLSRDRIRRLNASFQDNLALGRPNDWSCRAGARYLYVDEHGTVHYCSQMQGAPGVPLETYGQADIDREFVSKKACAPYCTINCVQRVGLFDNWRSPQTTPARPGTRRPAPTPPTRGEMA